MINPFKVSLQILVLPLLAGTACAQTAPAGQSAPPSLGAIFASQFASHLAAADTVAMSIVGVQNGATYQNTPLAANTYVQIIGDGLSTDPAQGRIWAGPDFSSNSNGTLNLPTSLDGTSVTVNGQPAYVYYVSPKQLNIIIPNITATGNGVPVVVNLNGQQSAAFSVTLQSLAPAFFAYHPDPSAADDGKYVVAVHAADSTRVGKVGLYPASLYPGIPPNFTTPAKPGETIILFGTGFGPTTPPIAPGIVTDARYDLSSTPTVTLGNITAQVLFAGLAPGEGQVYQFNIVIPPSAPDGDLALVVNVNGTLSAPGMITVQH